jgi:hypothetical protein
MHSPRLPRLLISTVICLLTSRHSLYAAEGPTTFTFTLDTTYVTSAGAYKPDGTLVRTLWRKVSYGPGPITRTWDNRDDHGNLVPAGNYQIKVLYHNTQYVFDGMIGNTSSPSSGTSVFYGGQGIHNLAITGNCAFFANGVNEGRQTTHYFDTTNMGQQIDIGHKDAFIGFDQVAADDNYVYFGGRAPGFNPHWNPPPGLQGYYTFVVRFSTTFDTALALFPPVPFPTPPMGEGVTLNTNHQPGVLDPNDHDTYWEGVVDVDQDVWPSPSPGPSPLNIKAPTGIAVQRAGQGNGNVLAVAHGGLNVVRLLEKTSGVLLRTISVPNPQGLAMSPDGSLWVISGQTVQKYSGPFLTQPGGKGNPTLTATASSDLNLPVAIAVSPTNLLIVADAGTHQQIKFFNSLGAPNPAWTYGQRGGYSSNGPDIALDKFGFQVGRGNNAINHTPLALQADGSLWIGDGAIRSLRRTNGYLAGTFSPAGTIMYFGEDGTSTVDAHNPKRVIGDGFLEFEVDYNAPIEQSWTLKKNWAAGLPASYFGGYSGLRSVITFRTGQFYGQREVPGNGRTYAVMSDNFGKGHREEIVELPASGPLRRTGIHVLQRDRYSGNDTKEDCSWESDGSLRYHVVTGNTVAFRQAHLAGFGDNGDPAWDAVDEQTLATAPATNEDPIIGPGYFVPPRHPKTATNVLVAFDAGPQGYCLPYHQTPQCMVEHDGWHLGGLKISQPPNQTQRWLWEVSPTISDLHGADLDGLGSFLIEHDDSIPPIIRPYAGTVVVAAGRNIVYHYHEEFYHNSGNASQWMHFYDDGLFVGQFGVPYDPVHEVSGAGAVPGSSALTFFPTMVMVDSSNNEAAPGTGETYIWGNTLSSHSGVIRWHIVGANQIREAMGMIALGETGTLANPTPPTFPTGLTAAPGNGSIALTWTGAPPPDTSYVVKVSTTSFGPPIRTSSGGSGTGVAINGLTNDSSFSPLAPYYCRIGGGTGSPSSEVIAYPFDRLGRSGQLVGGPAYPWQVSSVAQETNSPSLSGISSVVGNLARTSVGSKGYAIYGWQLNGGNRVDNIKTIDGYHINLGPLGWTTWGNAAHFRFDVDGVQGSATAVHVDPLKGDPNPYVDIVIPSPDSSVHYLTVFCPALNDPDSDNHIFDVRLTSQTAPLTPPAFYSNNSVGKYNRIYQFQFRGNVRLTISKPASAPRIGLQAIFLD